MNPILSVNEQDMDDIRNTRRYVLAPGYVVQFSLSKITSRILIVVVVVW